jgi:hypothetical protein
MNLCTLKNFAVPFRRGFLLTGVFALTVFAAFADVAVAAAPADAAATTAPLYGGAVSKTKSHVFETQLMPDGVRVWFYSEQAAPANVEKAAGTAKLKLPDGRNLELALTPRQPTAKEPGVYFCPMHASVVERKPGECKSCGGMKLYTQDYLFGGADLAGIAPNSIVAGIHITGLTGGEKDVTFTPAFPKQDGNAANKKAGR